MEEVEAKLVELQVVPCTVLKKAFAECDGVPVTPESIKECAKDVLLSTDECSIWLQH